MSPVALSMDIDMQDSNCTQQLMSAEESDPPSLMPDFVRKLFGMLEDNAYPNILFWGVDGTTFVVKDSNEFAQRALPKHFKHCNFASFVRQLNKYGFHKVRISEDGHRPYGSLAWEFKHPRFQYNKIHLLDGIKRKHSVRTTRAPSARNQKFAEKSYPYTAPFNPAQSNINPSYVVAQLQSQLDAVQKNYSLAFRRLQDVGQHYHNVFDTIQDMKLRMEAQDNMILNIIQNAADGGGGNLSRGRDTHPQSIAPLYRILDSYNAAAQTCQQQMHRLSQQVKDLQLQLQMHPTPPSRLTATRLGKASASSVPLALSFRAPQKTARPFPASSSRTVNNNTYRLPNQITPEGFTMLALSPKTSNVTPSNSMSVVALPRANSTRKARIPGWSIPPRVLLVDDDSMFRLLSTRLLQLAGCTIEVAVDGVDALQKLGNNNYDLVLMDIMMPNMDGISATRTIRSYDTETPIISITSNTTETDILTYKSNGMTDILQKPFYQLELNSILEKYCAQLMTVHRRHTNGQIPRTPGPIRMIMDEGTEQRLRADKGKQAALLAQGTLPTPTTPIPTQPTVISTNAPQNGDTPMNTIATSLTEMAIPSSTLYPPQQFYPDQWQVYVNSQAVPPRHP